MADESPAVRSLNADEFLRVEYQETHRYFLQIESTMHDLMKFQILGLVGLISISIALSKFVLEDETTNVPLFGMLSSLWAVFGAAGILLLYYYLELRVRKIIFVEQLAAIRAYQVRMTPELDSVLRLIKSVASSPRYLRRPSAEWYSILFFCASNSGGFLFALFALNKQRGFVGLDQPAYSLVLTGCGLMFFLIQFASVTSTAFANDLRREHTVGHSTYDLLPRRPSWIFLPLDLAASGIEWLVRSKSSDIPGPPKS